MGAFSGRYSSSLRESVAVPAPAGWPWSYTHCASAGSRPAMPSEGEASDRRSSMPCMYSAQREPNVAWMKALADATICPGSRADDSSRANS